MARQNQETITYAFLTKSSNINCEGDYFYQYIFMDHKGEKESKQQYEYPAD